MLGLSDIISIGGKLLDRIIPDPKARDEAKIKLLELEQAGQIKLEEFQLEIEKLDNALAMGQVETNKIEAADSNLFKSGWRPCIGWCCAFALLYDFLLRPIFSGFFGSIGFNFPSLDSSTLISLTLSLLGMSTLHSFENIKNGKGK